MEGRLNVGAGAVSEGKEENDDGFYLESLHCPIQQEPFKEPVIAADGHTYELTAFQRWVARKRTSPMTNAPLASVATQDNYTMKKAVAEYKQEIIPKLKVLKELEEQLPKLEALKKMELEKIQREKEIEQLKRVEKAFHEQKMTLDNVLRSEKQSKNRLQAVEQAFFRQGQLLGQERQQLIQKDQEITRLKQIKQAEPVSSRASCSIVSLFFPAASRVAGNDRVDLIGADSDLIRAIQGGQVGAVRQALTAQPNVNQRFGLDKATPLILAIRLYVTSPMAAKQIIEMLISHRARVDIGDCRGNRPLHWAAYFNLAWPAGYLLEKGANPLLKNRAGETPSQKLLKERSFNSSIMNRLLRAESRFSRYQEQEVFGRPAQYNPALYDPARYSGAEGKREEVLQPQRSHQPV